MAVGTKIPPPRVREHLCTPKSEQHHSSIFPTTFPEIAEYSCGLLRGILQISLLAFGSTSFLSTSAAKEKKQKNAAHYKWLDL